jgi:23S rRNA (pseudouridine1915-N3)-methyltransferase
MGHKMPSWIQVGVDEYTKRMPAESRIDLIELKPEDRASRAIPKVLSLEASRIRASIPKGAELIVLDERGTMVKTTELAAWLRSWMADGVSPCFVIGSADGLDPALKQTAKRAIALSGCTLPHGFARLILVEQLYRAWSLTENHPYHRE